MFPNLIPDSVEISSGIFWGGDFELTKNLINEGQIKKDNIRFFLGYTGWEAKQFENEMQSNSWIFSENLYANKIIGKSTTDFWKEKSLNWAAIILSGRTHPKIRFSINPINCI
jgi:putative transcriptional regulator